MSKGWFDADDNTVVMPAVTARPSPQTRPPGNHHPEPAEPTTLAEPSEPTWPSEPSVPSVPPEPPWPTGPSAPAMTPGDRVRTALGVTGEVLITMGVIVLLFVVYEVYVTDWLSAGKQRDATSTLDRQWSESDVAPIDPGNERTGKFRPTDGEGFAKLFVPAFGSDFVFTVLEGTADQVLEVGPGHYRDTAFPGEPGNFAVAGHRVGKGAPFNDLDLLRSCDALVVETSQSWFVYRVLPMRDEVGGWQTGRGTDQHCASVNPLGGPYTGVVGREIVLPSQNGVIAPVPDHPELSFDAVPPDQRAALITLTTCHPRFSAAKRLIMHGVFVKQYPKDPADPAARPPELTEG